MAEGKEATNPGEQQAKPRPRASAEQGMYEASKAALARGEAEDDPERRAYLQDKVDKYEARRADSIRQMVERRAVAEKSGDDEGVKLVDDWFDIREVKPEEILDAALPPKANATVETPQALPTIAGQSPTVERPKVKMETPPVTMNQPPAMEMPMVVNSDGVPVVIVRDSTPAEKAVSEAMRRLDRVIKDTSSPRAPKAPSRGK